MSAEYDLQNNPDSPIYEKGKQFDSSDLWECLEYYKQCGDVSHLENAISLNTLRISKAKEKAQWLLDGFKATEINTLAINKLTEILKELRK